MESKYYRLILVLVVFVIVLFCIYHFRNKAVLISIFIAYIIGILAIFQNEIRNWIFRPILTPSIKISESTTIQGIPTKYYNLNIKNEGFIPAKNIRVKIKSEKNKEWLSLLRPFWAISQSIFINKLSPQEEDDFNIGSIYKNQATFQIITDIKANNQILMLDSGVEHKYFLEIISDNTKLISFEVSVNNKGFSSNDIISLKT